MDRSRRVEALTLEFQKLYGAPPTDWFRAPGRVDLALLERIVPGLDADFYICGPGPFMDVVEAGLDRSGVTPGRVFFR